MKKGILIVLTFSLFTGCGTVKRGTVPWEENTPNNKPITTTEAADNEGDSNEDPEKERTSGREEDEEENAPDNFVEPGEESSVQEIQQFLQLAYQDWKGTPYLLGGSGYNGIDCSAFMKVVFEDYFLIQIPRTTREQIHFGRKVKRAQIQTGDLVFFKTGRTTFHVGVMINRNEFLHASTSNGVKISELSYPFWKENFETVRRVL